MKIHGLGAEIPIPLTTDQLTREIARLQTICDEQAKRIAELQTAGTELVETRRKAERERECDEARKRVADLEAYPRNRGNAGLA